MENELIVEKCLKMTNSEVEAFIMDLSEADIIAIVGYLRDSDNQSLLDRIIVSTGVMDIIRKYDISKIRLTTAIELSEDHRNFLNLIMYSDAANNISEAVQWCIEACKRIEEKYGVDACYVSYHGITHDVSNVEEKFFTAEDYQNGICTIDELMESDKRLNNVSNVEVGEIKYEHGENCKELSTACDRCYNEFKEWQKKQLNYSSSVSNVEEDEVTHKNFFGENIKRVSAALSEAGLFGKDNNRFVDIFKKLLKGEASEEEIKFAMEYSAKWQKKQLQK